ncbi:MAG: sensor histidine kinase [Solirubrobacteraceae bacterium]
MRRRLVIAIAAVAGTAVGLFALPLAIILQRNYRDQELLRLQRDTVAAARQIDLGTSSRDRVELPAGGDRFALYDLSGRRVAGGSAGGPPKADAVVRDVRRSRRPSVRSPSGALVAAVPLLTGERVTGAIRAQRSDRVVDARTRNAWLALAAAAIVLVALAAAAAMLLGRRLAAPLEHVALAARRLGDGDFSVRAPRGSVEEVDAVADALDATATRLGDLVARERAFSADASHQLRTPLAALRLEFDAMQLLDRAPERLDVAIAQVDRLQETIETLLAVARDTPQSQSRSDLVAVISDVEARWHGPLAHDGRPLRTALEATGSRATVRAAPTIVREILDVLVDNAHRHGAGPVTITLRAVDDWRAIDVTDAGSGVSAAESVFERGARQSDGHGIGLALARSLAHAEGGRLTLSHAGPRPVFTVLFAAG